MHKLKLLNESLGAKKKEIRAYLDAAEKEKRSIPADDGKLKQLEAEYESLQSQYDIEFRQACRESAKPAQLSTSERRTVEAFDVARALRGHYKIGGEQLNGAELEMVQEGAAEMRSAGVSDIGSGIVLPRMVCRRQDLTAFRGAGTVREQRDMTATGTTSVTGDQGGMLVSTQIGGLLDAFYNADVLESLGITTFDGLTSHLNIPRFIRGSAPGHKSEQGAGDEISPSLLTLALTPHRLPASMDVTDQLLMLAPSNFMPFLNNNLIRELRSKMQIALLHGSGGGNEPTGLAGTTGINAIYSGGAASNGTNADGAAPVYDDMVNFETGPADANADEGRSGYLFNTRLRGKLKRTVRAAGTDSLRIWDDRTGNMINGYRAFVTNAVSRTLTKGASNGILSGGFYSPNWADFVRAIFGGMALELVSDTTNRKAGTRTLIGSVFYNGGAQRPSSFAYCADFLTT